MVDRCAKHLVYLGFGIFLCLKKRSPPILETMPILGTVSSDDPATQRELLHSVGMKIKLESAFTGTTATPKMVRLPKASAAAGSVAQLERVEVEMKVEPSTDKSEVMPLPCIHPMVEKYHFEMCIRRLTPKEIEKHTVRSDQTNHSCTARPSLVTIRSSPVTTRSMTKRKISKGLKWRTRSGHLSQLLTQQRHTFKVRKHILHRHKHKTYMKCRVKGCTLAYITFSIMKDLNTHHRICHGNIVYKCHQCKKIINTPSM